MSLSIRNDLPSLKNLQNAARATAAYSPRTTAKAPPDGAASPELTAKLQSTMKEQFAAKAQDPKAFHALMAQVYGQGYDQAKAESLRQKALQGDFSWLPPVELVDSQTLGGANGAYNAKDGVVYINKDLAARDPKLAASTYVEEAGAHLDTMLNKSDTVGDEGEMLRRLMGGEKLSQAQVNEIRADNDHGTITVNGKEVAVEFWSIGGALKSVGSAIKGAAKEVGKAIKGGAKAVGGALKGTFGAVGSTLKNVGKNLFKAGESLVRGVGKMTVGFVGNLIQGKVGDAFKSFSSGAQEAVFGTVGGALRTVFTAIGDTLKVPTHLFPSAIGEKIRAGLDKAINHMDEQVGAWMEIGARITDVVNAPFNGFIADLETAVRKGISGDFKGLAKSFGSSFVNLPVNFGGSFLNVFSTDFPQPARF